MGSREKFLVVGLAIIAGCAAACASTDAAAPHATLARSLEAEIELRPILTAWSLGDRADRVALEPKIASFGARRGTDETALLADVLLAWIALEKGELATAERDARRVVSSTPPGSVSDLGRLTVGASLRRQGKDDEAYRELSPLVSKLIDPWARALLDEEAVRAAVGSGRSKEALTLMRIWLREAPPADRTIVETVIRAELARTRREDMLEVLARPPSLADEDVALRKLVTARLAQIAGDGAGDAALAKELLARAPALLGDDGDRVAHLAAGSRKARVEARTVGLLLDLRDDAARQRGAEILRGVTFGLGLPGSSARLVSRDASGRGSADASDRVNEALGALSADGASVIIAGADEEEAELAATFADAHHVPVLLLTPPATAHGGSASFVVGVSRAELEASVFAGLAARGLTPIGVLTNDAAHVAAPAGSVVRTCGDASSPWAGVASLVLLGDRECSRGALGKPPARPPFVAFVAGLGAAEIPLPPGSLVMTAGAFPFDAASGAGAGSPSAIRDWSRDHPGPPSYWAALARDASTLAWAAVQGLPAEGTEDPSEVAARRSRTGTALASVTAPLWTTEATGFRGAHAIPRTIGLRDAPRAASLRP